MLRITLCALFGLVWSGVARSDEKADEKELAGVKGMWLSKSKKNERNEPWHLVVEKGFPLMLLKKAGTLEDEKGTEAALLLGAHERDKKRYLKFIGLQTQKEWLVEYELSGDTLKLKGSVAGVDPSGEWTRFKEPKEKKKK